MYHYGGNNPIIYTDPTGMYSWKQLQDDFNATCNTIKNNPDVKKLSNFLTACEYKMYADVCVGAGISAAVLGLGIGGDIGSEHATFALIGNGNEKPEFDYQESMSIGFEALFTLEGSTPTPESARSFLSSTQKEPPNNGKAPIENMQYSFSYGPVTADKDGITLNINIGAQAILGIELGIEVTIPWNAWSELRSEE